MTPLASLAPTLLTLLGTSLGPPPAPAQDGPAPAPEPAGVEALVPGALPADVDPAARELWRALSAATTGVTTGRIVAFDLDFDVEIHSGERQSNDGSARYLYLEPGFVRMVLRSGRERVRGPEGDFLLSKGVVTSLAGRDYAEDRRELDETVAVARTFVGLSDPRQLRLASLEVATAPRKLLPELLSIDPAALDWIAVTSPDFRGVKKGQAARVERVEIGLDAESKLPALALVRDAANPQAAILVQLRDYRELDGYRVPGRISAWRIDPSLRPARFGERAAVEMWLKQGSLRPQIGPDEFRPPR